MTEKASILHVRSKFGRDGACSMTLCLGRYRRGKLGLGVFDHWLACEGGAKRPDIELLREDNASEDTNRTGWELPANPIWDLRIAAVMAAEKTACGKPGLWG